MQNMVALWYLCSRRNYLLEFTRSAPEREPRLCSFLQKMAAGCMRMEYPGVARVWTKLQKGSIIPVPKRIHLLIAPYAAL
jgi:hypothetical protein